MLKKIVFLTVLLNVAACSGLRTTDESYSAHAENFDILFLQIPGGDTQERALALAPEGGQIKSMASAPIDLTSFIGVVNRIIGIDITVVNGTTKKE
jgi:hypothetical protein